MIGIGIVAGAFGAHGLKGHFDAYSISIWEKAVLYHLLNAFGLLALSAILASNSCRSSKQPETASSAECTAKISFEDRLYRAAHLILLGTLIFSGSLYILALTGLRWLGAITPFGGSLMILGWFYLSLSKLPDQSNLKR